MKFQLLVNKSLLLFLVLLVGGWTAAAYANNLGKIDSCPPPSSVHFDRVNHQWKSTPDWGSDSQTRYAVVRSEKMALKSVKLKVNHEQGDAIECGYETAHGEPVVFTKATKAKQVKSSAVAKPAEVIPLDIAVWNNTQVKSEFVCEPSVENTCAFNEGSPLTLDTPEERVAKLVAEHQELMQKGNELFPKFGRQGQLGDDLTKAGSVYYEAGRPKWAMEKFMAIVHDGVMNIHRLQDHMQSLRILEMRLVMTLRDDLTAEQNQLLDQLRDGTRVERDRFAGRVNKDSAVIEKAKNVCLREFPGDLMCQ